MCFAVSGGWWASSDASLCSDNWKHIIPFPSIPSNKPVIRWESLDLHPDQHLSQTTKQCAWLWVTLDIVLSMNLPLPTHTNTLEFYLHEPTAIRTHSSSTECKIQKSESEQLSCSSCIGLLLNPAFSFSHLWLIRKIKMSSHCAEDFTISLQITGSLWLPSVISDIYTVIIMITQNFSFLKFSILKRKKMRLGKPALVSFQPSFTEKHFPYEIQGCWLKLGLKQTPSVRSTQSPGWESGSSFQPDWEGHLCQIIRPGVGSSLLPICAILWGAPPSFHKCSQTQMDPSLCITFPIPPGIPTPKWFCFTFLIALPNQM